MRRFTVGRYPSVRSAGCLCLLLFGIVLSMFVLMAPSVRAAVSLTVMRKVFDQRPASAVLCGDSNLATLSSAQLRSVWGWASSFNLATAGARTRTVIAQLELASTLRTRAVVVMTGTNDLAGPDEDLLRVMDVMLKARPITGQVFLLSAIPLQADPSRDNRITALNVRLAREAKENGWIFVDSNALLFPARTPRGAVLIDQVHFGPDAQRHLLREFAAVIAAQYVERGR